MLKINSKIFWNTGGIQILKRREIREHVFRMLFFKDFHETSELDEQIKLYFDSFLEPMEADSIYLKERYDAVLVKLDEIDQILTDAASGWMTSRMNKVDLTILRLAIYEMRFDEDIPVKVAINEAIEIAKIFGGEESPGFINGVLAKLA